MVQTTIPLRAHSGRLAARCASARGVGSLETALLMPFIVLFLLFTLQIAFYLLSAQATQYASYMAARSYMVYGDSSLADIQYQNTSTAMGFGNAGGLLTDDSQTIVETVAERIVFESLPWERHRIIVVSDDEWYTKRVYLDGNDGQNSASNNGAVRADNVNRQVQVNSKTYQIEGVKVTYCMPTLFPGLVEFFTAIAPDDEPNTCLDLRPVGSEKPPPGVPISFESYLGREP